MKIYKDQNLEIRWEVEHKLLINRFLRKHVIMKEVAQFTGAIELLSPNSVMLDMSKVESMEKYAKDLLVDDLTMQLQGRGVKKFALLRSYNNEINEFIFSLFQGEKMPKKLDIKDFVDEKQALAWLIV